MPFQSKQQSKACFATNGFGGKVDCKEFADETDYNSLPSKVMKNVGQHGSRKKKITTSVAALKAREARLELSPTKTKAETSLEKKISSMIGKPYLGRR